MGAAVLIFCNKCDVEGALPVEKIQEAHFTLLVSWISTCK